MQNIGNVNGDKGTVGQQVSMPQTNTVFRPTGTVVETSGGVITKIAGSDGKTYVPAGNGTYKTT